MRVHSRSRRDDPHLVAVRPGQVLARALEALARLGEERLALLDRGGIAGLALEARAREQRGAREARTHRSPGRRAARRPRPD